MGIFFGGVIYGVCICDEETDAVLYETKVDIGCPLDKRTIRKVMMDDDMRGTERRRNYSIYTFYVTTLSDNAVHTKSHMWRSVGREEIVAYMARDAGAR